MSRITILGGLALAIAASACSHTASGAKQDTKAMVKAADAGVQTTQIKTALMADSRVDAGDINVDTSDNSKTVTLKGTVPTDAQVKIAAQIAQEHAKSYKIVNELTVKRK